VNYRRLGPLRVTIVVVCHYLFDTVRGRVGNVTTHELLPNKGYKLLLPPPAVVALCSVLERHHLHTTHAHTHTHSNTHVHKHTNRHAQAQTCSHPTQTTDREESARKRGRERESSIAKVGTDVCRTYIVKNVVKIVMSIVCMYIM
jgi:hypothetical protein